MQTMACSLCPLTHWICSHRLSQAQSIKHHTHFQVSTSLSLRLSPVMVPALAGKGCSQAAGGLSFSLVKTSLGEVSTDRQRLPTLRSQHSISNLSATLCKPSHTLSQVFSFGSNVSGCLGREPTLRHSFYDPLPKRVEFPFSEAVTFISWCHLPLDQGLCLFVKLIQVPSSEDLCAATTVAGDVWVWGGTAGFPDFKRVPTFFIFSSAGDWRSDCRGERRFCFCSVRGHRVCRGHGTRRCLPLAQRPPHRVP